MLTFFLIITLTNFQIILSTENNDTTFVNSLPETQKKEFLQKVEKRIQNEVPEVKSTELNDTNVELYEKHLEDQGKSIQNILRSEVDILNRRNSNDKEGLGDHIDLTLRTQGNEPGATRRKNEGNGIEKDGLNIPVVVQYDSIDVNKHDSNPKNMSTENKNANIVKNGSKVDEITWDNISLATNESSIELKRTGRRSNDFDTMVKKIDNATVVKTDNNASSSLDSINYTTTVTTTSYNVDSAKTTKDPSDVRLKLESINPTAPNVSFDTFTQNLNNTQDEHKMTASTTGTVNTTNEEVTLINLTNETSSNSTSQSLRGKTDDKIDTTTQYNDNTKTDDEFSTKLYNSDEKTHNPSAIINVTVHDLDSSGATLGTTATPSPRSDPDRNNSNSDSVSKEDSERQPHFVPVHNYDPENAYYNANKEQRYGNNTEYNMPEIINLKKTQSKTTQFDIFTNKNESSLRNMDLKEISNSNIQQNSNLHELLSSDRSKEYSGDDVMIDKPLKHVLKKIRTSYESKIINKSIEDDENKTDINSITAETKAEDDRSPNYTNQYDAYIHNITDLFTNFGFLLQNLVHKSNNNETQSSKSKRDFYKGVSNLSIGIVKNIIKIIEDQEKVFKNTDTTQTTEVIKKVHNDPGKNSLKQIKEILNGKEYQSRFRIKDRNENDKQKHDTSHTSFDQEDTSELQVEFRDESFEKSATEIKDEYLEVHLKMLKDLVYRNDVALEKYDWLGTTVIIRSGLAKLQDITEKKLNGNKLHHLDQKLLEFATELYETAKALSAKQNQEPNASYRRKQRVSFRIPKKGKKVNVLNRMYNELKNTRTARNIRSTECFQAFKSFLDCLEMCLNNLHTAIKQVSLVTTYKKQRWFNNIKQLYLKPTTNKKYLELLLHLVMTRLMSLIDEIVKKNPGEDYMKDRAAIDRVEVEFMLVLRICNKLMDLSD